MNLLWILAIAAVLMAGACVQQGIRDIEEPPDMPRITEQQHDGTPEIEASDACDNMIFGYPPVNLEKTAVVVPLGLMSWNHVTPVDHQYFQDFGNDIADIEVYSPGDGRITSIQHMSGSYMDSGREISWADFRVVIDHGC